MKRRFFLFAPTAGVLCGMKLIPGAPRIGDLFCLERGDGDPEYFFEKTKIRLTEAIWFPKNLKYGEAMLFLVEGGNYAGEYVAVTSKSVGRLEDQITEGCWANVVVHRILNQTESFHDGPGDSVAIGMSIIYRI